MFASLQLLAYGAAALIDTVLLITLLDRRNYARVMLPVVLLACGTWLFHTGTFFHTYLGGLSSPWAGLIHWWAMTVMATGLVLMPCAMLHLLLRQASTGLTAHPPFNPRMSLAYALLLFVPLAIGILEVDLEVRFLEALRPFVFPYVVSTSIINLCAVVACFRVARETSTELYRVLGFSILGMTALIGTTVPLALAWPDGLPFLQALTVLAPVLPVVLFTYFVVRFNFLQVFIERTVLYAATAVLLLLVFQLALHDVHARIEDEYGVNAEILQGTLIFVVVLLIPALRRRLLESLRYFVLGGRIDALRQEIRRIAIHITEQSGEPPTALFTHTAQEIEQAFSVAYVAGWLSDDQQQLTRLGGDSRVIPSDELTALYDELANRPHQLFTRHDAPSRAALAGLVSADASAAMAFSANRVRGLIVLGRRARNRDFGEEEASILMVLAEQLAVAMDNSLLQAQQLAAERLAFQNERLTTLGLLASAVAHEVKNPLSSIKTIASVLAEDLGPDSPHTEDLRLVISETNRLAATTSQLLGFARPGAGWRHIGLGEHNADDHARDSRHHAREQGIELVADVPEQLPAVRVVCAALQEILFNLLTNAIEAAGRGGRVSIRCAQENGHVVAEVHDTGPGIAPEIQDRLFRPFMTTKAAGTGLGLYIVSCHVRDAGGEIHCQSQTNQGTTFVIRLPVAES